MKQLFEKKHGHQQKANFICKEKQTSKRVVSALSVPRQKVLPSQTCWRVVIRSNCFEGKTKSVVIRNTCCAGKKYERWSLTRAVLHQEFHSTTQTLQQSAYITEQEWHLQCKRWCPNLRTWPYRIVSPMYFLTCQVIIIMGNSSLDPSVGKKKSDWS